MNKRLFEVLLAPLVSEKATNAADREHSVVFWVKPDSNKIEIRHAVEAMFSVKVRCVRTATIRGKARGKGIAGPKRRSKDRKKAYVSLMPGHEISFANE